MKKLTLIIALAALVVFAGCKKENGNGTKGTIVKASIEQNMGDRTSLHPMGTTAEIHWTAGDKILVNNGTTSAIFTLDSGAGTKTGTFNYDGDYTFDASNVAVYPETATVNGNTVSLTLPEVQTFTAAGTFGNGANPMLCTFTDPESLNFTSLCGVLGVSLTGDNVDITGIEIVSNNANEKLNGLFEADCTAAQPQLEPAAGNSGTNRVMLNCNATLTSTAAQEFYVVLPVGTLANGFTMNVYNGGTEPFFSKTTQSTALVVDWNMVKTMATLEVIEHAYVDLGLPSGLLWATCNVGAHAPEEYGDYFAWGETTPKDIYNWGTYQYCMGSSSSTMTKYCNNSEYGYNGFTDDLTTLEPSDDAATANWGGGWRMPTKAEFEELYNNTTMTWTTQNSVNGRLFTASNGNSLFLPAAGYRYYSSLYDAGSYGFYWSSSLSTDYPNSSWAFRFDSGNYNMHDISRRCYGQSVRPVREN